MTALSGPRRREHERHFRPAAAGHPDFLAAQPEAVAIGNGDGFLMRSVGSRLRFRERKRTERLGARQPAEPRVLLRGRAELRQRVDDERVMDDEQDGERGARGCDLLERGGQRHVILAGQPERRRLFHKIGRERCRLIDR